MPTPILGLPYPTSADTADVPRDVKALADAIDPLGVVPVGALMMWPSSIAPTAWLICDGHQVLAADYPKLAAVLGSAGGQITLPDLKDRFPMGATNPAAVLGAGGANSVALQTLEMPAHSHAVSDPGHNHALGAGGGHGHALQILNGDVIDPSHTIPRAGGVVAIQAVHSPPAFSVPYSTADGWAGTQGNHGHAGSSALPVADHLHSLAAAATGITTQPVGGVNAHENRPQFLSLNFIIRAV